MSAEVDPSVHFHQHVDSILVAIGKLLSVSMQLSVPACTRLYSFDLCLVRAWSLNNKAELGEIETSKTDAQTTECTSSVRVCSPSDVAILWCSCQIAFAPV